MISRRAFIGAVAGGLAVAPAVNGPKPGHLPVGQPTRRELVINLKTPSAPGSPYRRLLARADEVIQ